MDPKRVDRMLKEGTIEEKLPPEIVKALREQFPEERPTRFRDRFFEALGELPFLNDPRSR